MQKKSWLVFLGMVTLMGVMLMIPTNVAAKTVNQHRPAITVSKHPKLKFVNNPHLKLHNTNTYATGVPLDFITSNRGNNPMNFGTFLALPNNWPAPQSMAMTPDGRALYVLYNANGAYSNQSNDAFIVRYQLHRSNAQYLRPEDTNIQVGAVFNSGHNKSLAYNPKSNQLWVSSQVANNKMMAQQIDLNQLGPKNQVNFKVNDRSINYNSSLTFDQRGNAYTYAIGTGHRFAKGSLIIYKGKMSASGVHFNLVKMALRHAPARKMQALSYDLRSHQLAFIANDEVLKVPSDHLNRLKFNDLRLTLFISRREFKGMVWNREGDTFLLVNRLPEIMRYSKLFHP